MKVRFGFACRGQADLALDDFPKLVDNLERLGFDSIWLPEIMLNGPFDPLVALAHAAARTERLKIGAYVIVPGRNPVRLARELANLDRLSQGRLLLIMVLGQPDAPELLAQGVNKAERGALLEEVIPLLRRLWLGDIVNHEGPRYPTARCSACPGAHARATRHVARGQLPVALRARTPGGRLDARPYHAGRSSKETQDRGGRRRPRAGRTIDPDTSASISTFRRARCRLPRPSNYAAVVPASISIVSFRRAAPPCTNASTSGLPPASPNLFCAGQHRHRIGQPNSTCSPPTCWIVRPDRSSSISCDPRLPLAPPSEAQCIIRI